MSKILFLIRAAPDIDHLVPVVDKICSTTEHEVKLVGIDPLYKYCSDERITFLRKAHNIQLHSFFSDIPVFYGLQKKILSLMECTFINKLSVFAKLQGRLIIIIQNWGSKKDIHIFLNNFNPDLLICDHNWSSIVKRFVDFTKKVESLSISLPHSAENWTNKLRITTFLSFSGKGVGEIRKPLFDYVVFPNEHDPSFPLVAEKKVILGSARFSKSWVLKKETLFGSSEYKFPRQTKNTKILFLYPKKQNNIFWEELLRSIEIMISYDFSIVFKLPVRGRHLLPKKYESCEKVELSDDPTGVLVDWADVVFYIDTTVIFEAMIKDKTVVHLKHLHINTCSTDNLRGICRTYTRDDLVELLEKFEKDPSYRSYNSSDTAKILKEVVYPNETEEPLEDYMRFINELFLKIS